MRVGVYPMVADILHPGHLLAIEEAKKNCDYLVVALHCCPNYKDPVQTIYERFMQLRAVKWIDEVIPYYDKYDAATMLKSFNYDVYFLGEDHKGKEWENKELLSTLGKEVIYLPRQHDFSSTNFKIRIVDKEMNINEEVHTNA